MSLKDVYLLGSLPADLRAAVEEARRPPYLSSSLRGVVSSSSSLDNQATLTVEAEATISFTDTLRRVRWSARVCPLADVDPVPDIALRDGSTRGNFGSSSLNASRTLFIDESTWQSEKLHDDEPTAAPSPALVAPSTATPEPTQGTRKNPTAREERSDGRPLQLTVEKPGDDGPHRELSEASEASPASPTSAVASGLAALTNTKAFHFYADETLEKSQPHPGAAKMTLGEVLARASPSSPDGVSCLVEPLVLDIVHFLAPSPRSLRDVLQYIFGAPALTAAAASSSTLHVSFRNCPRSARYRDNFSLSDVKHLADLLCVGQERPGIGKSHVAQLQLQLSGTGYCFVDVDRYESKWERQKAANRAYTSLADLIEKNAVRALNTGANPRNDPQQSSQAQNIVPFEPAAAQPSSLSVSPLVRKYFDESAVVHRLLSMELLVDRDTVLAVKSRAGGAMQGLKRHADPASPSSTATDKRQAETGEGEYSFRDGSANPSEGDEEEEQQRQRRQQAAASVLYTSLQDIRIDWKEGDLSPFLPDNRIPEPVDVILSARSAARLQRDSTGGDAAATYQAASATKAGEADRKRVRLDGALTSDSRSLLALEPLPITTVETYDASLKEYRVLQRFCQEVDERLQRYADISHEAQHWSQRVDRSRWAPSLTHELRTYFDANTVKAQWLVSVRGTVGKEAYRLERELRDFVTLQALGVLPL